MMKLAMNEWFYGNGYVAVGFMQPKSQPKDCLSCGQCCRIEGIQIEESCAIEPCHRNKTCGMTIIKMAPNGYCPYHDETTHKCSIYNELRPLACSKFKRGCSVYCYDEFVQPPYPSISPVVYKQTTLDIRHRTKYMDTAEIIQSCGNIGQSHRMIVSYGKFFDHIFSFSENDSKLHLTASIGDGRTVEEGQAKDLMKQFVAAHFDDEYLNRSIHEVDKEWILASLSI